MMIEPACCAQYLLSEAHCVRMFESIWKLSVSIAQDELLPDLHKHTNYLEHP